MVWDRGCYRNKLSLPKATSGFDIPRQARREALRFKGGYSCLEKRQLSLGSLSETLPYFVQLVVEGLPDQRRP